MDNKPSIDKNKPVSGLYIVATPIGNLRDITLRALDVLQNADLIICEDTRVSNRLLSNYGIKNKLYVYNDHSGEKDRATIFRHLSEGKVIALISDAGTPLISDPGYKLIREAREQGFAVSAVPGPCSPIAALTISGLPTDRFFFEGFLSPKQKARKDRLEELAKLKASLIFFESAKRVGETLNDLQEILGDRPAVIARELTKKFEEVISGKISELIAICSEKELLGEIIIIVNPADNKVIDEEDLYEEIKKHLKHMKLKEAVQEVAEKTGINRKKVYQEALKIQNNE